MARKNQVYMISFWRARSGELEGRFGELASQARAGGTGEHNAFAAGGPGPLENSPVWVNPPSLLPPNFPKSRAHRFYCFFRFRWLSAVLVCLAQVSSFRHVVWMNRATKDTGTVGMGKIW